jgi:protein-L-isoaspartate(D-aspartate) O-methyltransferase
METDDPFQSAREAMVRGQIIRRGIRDPRLIDALLRVPRHKFIPPALADRAYDDGPLAIGQGQTISQPYIVAAMTDLLKLRGTENVLEIGTGSGYQAAILGELAATVHTIERHPELAHRAQAHLAELGYKNVFVHIADGSLGWPPAAPYHGILVTAASPEIPQPLIDQLENGGRLIIPIGNRYGQDLERWQKTGHGMTRESIFPVAFVPLRGQHGWRNDEWEDTID